MKVKLRGDYKVDVSWVPPRELPDIPEGSVIACDTETKDPELIERGPGWAFDNGHIVGVALKVNNTPPLYYPLRHRGGNNWHKSELSFFSWLAYQAKRKDLSWCFANANYDIGWLENEGVLFAGAIHDVQVQAPLLDEYRRSYSLDNLGKDYLGVGKDTSLMDDWAKAYGIKKSKRGANIHMMPSTIIGPYAEQDVEVTWRLHQHFMPMLDNDEVREIYDMEMELLAVLYRMRRRGVAVSLSKAKKLHEKLIIEQEEVSAHLLEITGETISPWDTEVQIAALRKSGIEEFPLTKVKGDPSLKAGWLESLTDNDVAQSILRLRRVDRQRVTFVERLIFDHHHNGRIHASFSSLRGEDGGTVTGRFSCSDPNLQQLPARDEEAARAVRGLFVGDEDKPLWAACDYSSQEPRLAVHFGAAIEIESALELAAKYRENPRLDLHQLVADLMEIPRKKAKILNLAQMYGQGAGSLCAALGLPFTEDWWAAKKRVVLRPGPEGEELLEKYDELVPFMRELSNEVGKAARRRGYIKTLLGRKCRFPMVAGERWYLHKAFNKLIQGSAADMTKAAMIAADKAGFRVLVSVHDELGFAVESEDEARECAKVMNSAAELLVPVVCDLEVGPSWGQGKTVEVD
jgi:DNA polymerase I-like protein with 3'-5' exonuclease and polymerase domains